MRNLDGPNYSLAYFTAAAANLPIFAQMEIRTYSTEDILARLNIDALNEMQLASIEAVREHPAVILLSATGTGKTLAFLLPLIQLLDTDNKKTQALIIVPSRELALQIEKVFRSLGTHLKVTCCYGGHLRETEENNLLQPPALIIGTPGRLADHIRRGNITTDSIQILVLDEFDKSLESGFEDELSFVIHSLPAINKRVLTSATDAVEIPSFVGIAESVRLNYLGDPEQSAQRLTIKALFSDGKDKLDTLFRLICALGNRSMVIFCNHRESVERTSAYLTSQTITNVYYHGAMEQQERDSALCKYRNGSANILVTTDLASRGLDIPNIRYIIHYHLPHTEQSFIHRNGRTARVEASGTAILILSPEEKLPPYIPADVEQMTLPETSILPEKPKWSTLFITAGKKDKVNKIDIAGFLMKKGNLKKEDIGLIEVKDYFSFAAVKKIKVGEMLRIIKNEKMKNKKVKIEVAK